jgi:hypothetical protein
MRAYWLWPARIAAIAASLMKSGPSKLGKPWPRLTAPCWSGEARHLGEDGGAEALKPGAEVRLSTAAHAAASVA